MVSGFAGFGVAWAGLERRARRSPTTLRAGWKRPRRRARALARRRLQRGAGRRCSPAATARPGGARRAASSWCALAERFDDAGRRDLGRVRRRAARSAARRPRAGSRRIFAASADDWLVARVRASPAPDCLAVVTADRASPDASATTARRSSRRASSCAAAGLSRGSGRNLKRPQQARRSPRAVDKACRRRAECVQARAMPAPFIKPDCRSGRPSRPASRFSTARSAMRVRVAMLALPMCGVSTRFGAASSGLARIERLVREDVERGGRQPAARERGGERRLVDDAAARRVHEDRPRAHARRSRGAEISPRVSGASATCTRYELGLRASRRLERQASTPGTERGERDQPSIAHAEAGRAPRHGSPDRAQPDDPERRAVQVAPEQGLGIPAMLEAPAPVAHVAVGFRNPARRREQQPERQIGGGLRQHARACARPGSRAPSPPRDRRGRRRPSSSRSRAAAGSRAAAPRRRDPSAGRAARRRRARRRASGLRRRRALPRPDGQLGALREPLERAARKASRDEDPRPDASCALL